MWGAGCRFSAGLGVRGVGCRGKGFGILEVWVWGLGFLGGGNQDVVGLQVAVDHLCGKS